MLPGSAFFAFMGFSADPSETWVRWIFLRFVDFMGRFVGFILGFVGFMGCSLIFREVRWICPGFVDFMGCSLVLSVLYIHEKFCRRIAFISSNLSKALLRLVFFFRNKYHSYIHLLFSKSGYASTHSSEK